MKTIIYYVIVYVIYKNQFKIDRLLKGIPLDLDLNEYLNREI